MAISNKDNSLKAIAIGLCLCRAICRAVCIQMRELLAKLLEPYKLGVVSRDETIAAANAARRFLNSKGCGYVKIYFRNALNKVSREALLEAVTRITLELSRLVFYVYERHSVLFYEDNIIHSERGVQQSDPSNPLLFTLALGNLSDNSIAPFTVYYLDDATIGGKIQSVYKKLERKRIFAGFLGLQLNKK